ncbi:MAG: hypothetical protein ACO1RT_13240 [Planctomycetaceae bacterium]
MATATVSKPLTHDEACELIGKTFAYHDGSACRIIGVDNKPPKCREGVYLVLIGADRVRKFVSVG